MCLCSVCVYVCVSACVSVSVICLCPLVFRPVGAFLSACVYTQPWSYTPKPWNINTGILVSATDFFLHRAKPPVVQTQSHLDPWRTFTGWPREDGTGVKKKNKVWQETVNSLLIKGHFLSAIRGQREPFYLHPLASPTPFFVSHRPARENTDVLRTLMARKHDLMSGVNVLESPYCDLLGIIWTVYKVCFMLSRLLWTWNSRIVVCVFLTSISALSVCWWWNGLNWRSLWTQWTFNLCRKQ